jgi:hypothetical protein
MKYILGLFFISLLVLSTLVDKSSSEGTQVTAPGNYIGNTDASVDSSSSDTSSDDDGGNDTDSSSDGDSDTSSE